MALRKGRSPFTGEDIWYDPDSERYRNSEIQRMKAGGGTPEARIARLEATLADIRSRASQPVELDFEMVRGLNGEVTNMIARERST